MNDCLAMRSEPTSLVSNSQVTPSAPPPHTPARPILPSLVTSAAWSGCPSGRALSAGDCPACVAPPSGTAPPPLLCAGWLASYFVRLEILLQTKNSESAAGAKARRAGPLPRPQHWTWLRSVGVQEAELVQRDLGGGRSPSRSHFPSLYVGCVCGALRCIQITAATEVLILAPGREGRFFCCSGMHPEHPEQCTVGAGRTPAHVHERILHRLMGCLDSLPVPRRMLTFQGGNGLSHLAQQESPILHVFQSHHTAGRGGVLL